MTSEPSSSAPNQPLPAESAEWLRFWQIVVLATILPFLILLAVLDGIGWSIGETYAPAALLRALDQHPDMVWMGARSWTLPACSGNSMQTATRISTFA